VLRCFNESSIIADFLLKFFPSIACPGVISNNRHLPGNTANPRHSSGIVRYTDKELLIGQNDAIPVCQTGREGRMGAFRAIGGK